MNLLYFQIKSHFAVLGWLGRQCIFFFFLRNTTWLMKADISARPCPAAVLSQGDKDKGLETVFLPVLTVYSISSYRAKRLLSLRPTGDTWAFPRPAPKDHPGGWQHAKSHDDAAGGPAPTRGRGVPSRPSVASTSGPSRNICIPSLRSFGVWGGV